MEGHKGRPEPIAVSVGSDSVVLTNKKGQDRKIQSRKSWKQYCLAMLFFEEVLSFRKKDTADEKCLILHKVQTRFSHVRH